MNRPCKELKRISRENLTGQYRIPMGALLVSWIIPQVIELPFSMAVGEHPTLFQNITLYAAEFLIALVSFVLTAGIAVIHLNIARKKEVALGMVLCGFKEHADRFILAGIFRMLAVLLGMLPFLIGYAIHRLFFNLNYILLGILLVISIAITIFFLLNLFLVLYLVIDRPELSVWCCVKNSMQSMRTHKKRLFYTYLSFLSLVLLCVLSMGIGILWVQPYQEQTLVNFYLDVTGQLPTSTQAAPGSAEYRTFQEYI
ncbi:MAG: DUF975 family protein [Agathobacter sp.]|nr:DUF975 family protein [Agathobacter sp.]